MRFLIRVNARGLPRDGLLEAARTVAKTLGVDPRNPKWTSYGALELDVFAKSRADFDLFVEAFSPLAESEFTKDLSSAPPYKEEGELYKEARELFNAERYWECHEVLEGIWRQKEGEEKSLIQGVILVCAAYVHHQKGEEEVALGVLARAVRQLKSPRRVQGGIDVHLLEKRAEEVLATRRFKVFRV